MAWSIAYEVPVIPITVQPSAGSVGLIGQTPVVGSNVLPATGSLSTVGQAVSAVLATTLVPSAGVMAVSGLAPTVVTAQTNIRPSSGALSVIGSPPGVSVSLVSGAPLGANINFAGLGSIRGEPVSQDGVANCRSFTQVSNQGVGCPLSSAGWPITDFVCILIEGQRGQQWMLGTWKCGFTGTGNETISNNGLGQATKTSAPGNPNVTFDLTISGFTDGQVVGNVAAGFQVTGTTNGVTNVFAYLPAYASSAGNKHLPVPLTANEFIAMRGSGKLGPIRFMQPQNVIFNASTCTSANRNTPANCVTGQNAFGTAEFYSQEYCVKLAGDCGAPAWVCVPIGADNTYYASMAAGILPYTVSGGGACAEVDVEIGNELWGGNGGAGQNGALVSLSQAYNTANPGVLNYDGNSNQQTIAYRWLATRYHDLAVAMQAVFGAAFGTTVKLVFMSQAAGSGAASFLPPFLQFLVHQYGGSPGQWIHAIGCDTYDNRDNTSIPGDGVNHEGTTGTPSQIQSQWQAHGQYGGLLGFNETYKAYALKYGLGCWSYEGSPNGGVDPGLADSFVASVGATISDSGMQSTTQLWAQGRFNLGWDRLIHYASGVATGNGTGSDSASPAYSWGVTESVLLASGSPNYNAALTFKSGALPVHRNQITARGQSILGVNYLNNVVQLQPQNPALTNFSGSGIEGSYEQAWIFQLSAGAGSYQFTLNYTGSGTVNFYVDGKLITAGINVPSGTNATVILGTVTLTAGFHYFELGTGSNQAITINSTLVN